ncbi:hypothetical protein BBH51_02375 [Aggregatibacter actinomycetemcomitans]|uniref:DUF2322 family protein n=1 Tax=Aggregatibacter actinomycetemcomitans TaxID=714 RepID=UPI00022ABCC5|nr:DUF2322 family protein [Aggregatibacter actinomycetemcomitans]KYK96297.1 RNA polymerase subunit sigma-32 [Aggregatibacter actinomycetemcomitans serotype d str. SA3733]ANU81587.1 hypothetical protein BBH51_02375 [Aggregatibacter actinomycetemcomitans]KOE65750.1 RNA polymerase subunit sigma-32 [Aggregatibacter actinomycetemcomitans serotype e str. A160]KOE67284.1 RNA polymerase subunit sigma-32 [Aggregatibacter actinomycetemcomitans serotype d str. I63B]KOE68692.1 RNA polymerase subunit sigma
MNFNEILATLPAIDHLSGIHILHNGTLVHEIPAIAGKLGSLRVYNALAVEFNGKLDRTSVQKGLQLFAEHTEDARQNPGKHPNIDLLLRVIEHDLTYQIKPLTE